jgi:hypothetical protein
MVTRAVTFGKSEVVQSVSSTAQKGSAKDKAQADLIAQRAELSRFEYRQAEPLRIAGEHRSIPSGLYNGLADAWNDFLNDLPSLSDFNHDQRLIALALETYHLQHAQRAEKDEK